MSSTLDLTLEGNEIVLTPIDNALDLETLLAESPRECFTTTEEDREWIDDQPKDREL